MSILLSMQSICVQETSWKIKFVHILHDVNTSGLVIYSSFLSDQCSLNILLICITNSKRSIHLPTCRIHLCIFQTLLSFKVKPN